MNDNSTKLLQEALDQVSQNQQPSEQNSSNQKTVIQLWYEITTGGNDADEIAQDYDASAQDLKLAKELAAKYPDALEKLFELGAAHLLGGMKTEGAAPKGRTINKEAALNASFASKQPWGRLPDELLPQEVAILRKINDVSDIKSYSYKGHWEDDSLNCYGFIVNGVGVSVWWHDDDLSKIFVKPSEGVIEYIQDIVWRVDNP